MKLQPLEEFAASNGKPEWKGREEWLLYFTETERFRVTHEWAHHSETPYAFAGLWRNEQLEGQGVSASCEDAKEFAQKMLDTMLYHLSPHQIQHLGNAINKFLEQDHQERVAHYAKSPEFFGPNPPSRISEHCPD